MGIRNSIAGALPALVTGHDQLLTRAHALGIDFDVANFGGVRTFADTVLILAYRAADYAAAVAANPSLVNTPINTWRPIAPFGSSMHNYGAAFDVVITKAPPGESSDSALQQLKGIAPEVGLRSTVPNDPPHFELPMTLEQAKALWEAQGNAQPGVIQVLTSSNVAAASTVAVIVAALLALAALRRRTGRT
jgi:hypothetical protein